jgi:hypothetical protein
METVSGGNIRDIQVVKADLDVCVCVYIEGVGGTERVWVVQGGFFVVQGGCGWYREGVLGD